MTVYVQFFKNKALFCSGMIMILSSIVFGAMSTFIPLYTVREGFANAGIFLTIQAITVVIARFYLRKYVPSDGFMASPFYDDCLNVTDDCFNHCSFWTTY